jgi:hypothetical protein
VEGVGIEFRPNRRKLSLTAFVGSIVRPAKGSGNLAGVAITSALTRSLKTLGYSIGALRRHASSLPRVAAAYNPAKGLKAQALGTVISGRVEPVHNLRSGAKEPVESLEFIVLERAHALSSPDPPWRAQRR